MQKELRVLVVEDCLDTAESCCQLLSLWGYQRVAVCDGKDALAAARSFDPDVVLLDIGLPGLNGFEVAARLRAEGLADAVLVALTGWGRECDRRRAADAGIDHFLVKPACPDELERLLASIRRLRQAGDDWAIGRGAGMIVVKLFLDRSESPDEAGTLMFFGTPVGAADGLALMEFAGGEYGSHAQVRVHPVGIVSEDEIAAIGLALCRDEASGRAGRYLWKYE